MGGQGRERERLNWQNKKPHNHSVLRDSRTERAGRRRKHTHGPAGPGRPEHRGPMVSVAGGEGHNTRISHAHARGATLGASDTPLTKRKAHVRAARVPTARTATGATGRVRGVPW